MRGRNKIRGILQIRIRGILRKRNEVYHKKRFEVYSKSGVEYTPKRCEVYHKRETRHTTEKKGLELHACVASAVRILDSVMRSCCIKSSRLTTRPLGRRCGGAFKSCRTGVSSMLSRSWYMSAVDLFSAFCSMHRDDHSTPACAPWSHALRFFECDVNFQYGTCGPSVTLSVA